MPRKSGLHLGIDAINIRQGGGLTHLSQLLQAADPIASGFNQVTVWTCRATAVKLPVRPWLNIRNTPWMEASLPRRMAGQQFQLPRDVNEAGCDILFSPGGTLPAWCSVPTVTISQNMLPFEPSEAFRFGRFSPMRLKMALLRHSQRRSFRQANGLIFLTEYAEKTVSRFLGVNFNRTARISHGIEQRFLQVPRSQRQMADCSKHQPFRVLYVSILMPYKHQMEVAQAVSRLRNQDIPIEVRFIGAAWGDYGPQFQSLLDRLDPLREYLLWSGAEPFESLHEFYLNADLFAFASSCENMPNILIEAMAAGLPIASSDRGPMPEVLGDAGVYFDPDSPASITEAFRRLILDTPLRASLAESAWRKAQNYSWERCADATFAFIADVARQAGAR